MTLSQMGKEDREKQMVEELKSIGYFVKKKSSKTKRHTFEVQEDVLEAFFDMVEEGKYKIKVAINEALRDWIEKQGSKKG